MIERKGESQTINNSIFFCSKNAKFRFMESGNFKKIAIKAFGKKDKKKGNSDGGQGT